MEKKISPNLTLFALAINAFAIGSTEFISVGLLPMIVKSFHNSNNSNNCIKTFGSSNKNNCIPSNTFTCNIFSI